MQKIDRKLLLIEDNEGDARLIKEMLRDEEVSEERIQGYHMCHVDSLEEGLRRLACEKFDAILLDLGLPDSQGYETFDRIYREAETIPIVVLSGSTESDVAIQAVREGAQDYFVKNQVNSSLLANGIEYAIERKRLTNNQQKIEGQLREEKNFVATVLDIVDSLVIVTDKEGRVLRFNRLCEEISGYSANEIESRIIWEVPLCTEDKKNLEHIYQQIGEGTYPVRYENLWRSKAKDKRNVEWSSTAMLDENNQVEYVISSGNDITEKKLAEEKIRYLAFHDNLTSLPNRRLFFDRLNFALPRARRFKHYVALLYIDLDGFKKVNDTMGHEAGDCLLRSVSERIKLCLRDMDTMARLGGDEFGVILQDLQERRHSETVAKRIIRSLLKPFGISNKEVSVGASIGISVYPENGSNAEELVKNADMAMYQVKKNGKNSCCFYQKSDDVVKPRQVENVRE